MFRKTVHPLDLLLAVLLAATPGGAILYWLAINGRLPFDFLSGTALPADRRVGDARRHRRNGGFRALVLQPAALSQKQNARRSRASASTAKRKRPQAAFFSISRFSRSAFTESVSSLALIRKASSPPR